MSDKKTINLKICTGTTCYVMGASDLLTIEDYLPEAHLEQVSIKGSTCLGLCKAGGAKPPFAEVNGRVIAEATVEKLLQAVETEYKG